MLKVLILKGLDALLGMLSTPCFGRHLAARKAHGRELPRGKLPLFTELPGALAFQNPRGLQGIKRNRGC